MKRIALSLALILFFTQWSGFSLTALAATTSSTGITKFSYGFQRVDRHMSYGGIETVSRITLGEINTLEENEATFKIDMTPTDDNQGLYTLTYYLKQSGSEEAIKVDLSIYHGTTPKLEQDGTVIPGQFSTVSVPPGAVAVTLNVDSKWRDPLTDNFFEWVDDNGMGQEGNTKTVMSLSCLETATVAEKQLHMALFNTSLNLLWQDDALYISTNGMKKDYIFPFDLWYKSSGGTNMPTGNGDYVGGFNIFKGFSTFEITPVHLNGSFDSLDSINLVDDDPQQPGSKPGVKISLSMPKEIKSKGSIFEFEQAENVQGDLNLRSKNEGTVLDYDINLDFELKDKGVIEEIDFNGLADAGAGTVRVVGDTAEIYITKDQVTDGGYTSYKWDKLVSAMILSADIYMGGTSLERPPSFLGLTQDVIEKIYGTEAKPRINRYQPDPQVEKIPSLIGNTYPQVKVEQGTGSDIIFEVETFQQAPLVYELVQKRENTIWDLITFNQTTLPTTNFIKFTTSSSSGTYRIVATNNDTYVSQWLMVRLQGDTIPPITEIESINNVYVVPSERPIEPQTPPIAVGFDIDWKAPFDLVTTYLDKGDLYYELYLQKSDSANEVAVPISIFKVSQDGSEIKVEPYQGSVLSAETGTTQGYYNRRSGSFTMQGVELKVAGETYWEGLQFQDADYMNGEYYPSPSAINVIELKDYNIPGTYFLKMKPVFADREDKVLSTNLASNLKALSLDFTEKVIPVVTFPQNADVDTYQATMYFEPSDLREYIKYMITPSKYSLVSVDATDTTKRTRVANNRTYEVYFYQDSNLNVAALLNTDADSIIDGGVISTGGALTLTADQKDALRKGGKVLKYTMESTQNKPEELEKIVFSGLDANQAYYVQIRTKLDIDDTVNNKIINTRYSLFSSVFSFTTATIPLPPSVSELSPPAPGDFFIRDQLSNTSVVLGWEAVEAPKDLNNVEVYYEFLRIQDNRLGSEEKDTTLTVKEILQKDTLLTSSSSSSYFMRMAFQTNGGIIQKMTSRDLTWRNLDPIQTIVSLSLRDDNLAPNTIYYYYIRTVYKFVDKGNEEVYSEWIMVPVTTSPVERPINLQVEKSKTTSSTTGYSYDPKNETVISFYAAIPEGETVGTSGKYEFEIAVRGENDEDFNLNYTATPITALSGYEEIAGYRYFVYRIEGLKAGTRYDIKVRVVDKTTEKDKDGDYPKSLYSDQVMLRTEYDEDEANKTAKYEEYLKKYDSETEKLRRQEFWEGDTSTYSGVYKYRESYVDSAFNGQSQYTLATKSGATSVTYYLPKTMLENASDAQSMIEIVLGDYAAYIRPDTLTSSNATVKDMVTEVEKTKYKDYYIVVQMNLYTHTEVVGTAQPVSKEIFLNMSLIPVLEEDRIVEDDIMDALVDQIETYRLSVIKSLEKEMTKEGISEERLTTIIETAVTDIHTAHQKDVARILKNQLGSKTDIDTISKAILLQATLKDVYSATAYYLQEKTWTPKYSFNINGKYSVEADKLGSYIFAGLTSIVSLVPEVPGAQDLITKYQLTTIFNLPKGINNTVTKKQVYDAVSRVLGASLNTDGTVYLQNNGIKGIVSGTASQAMRQDEAIYVIMQAYEKIHHTSVDNLFISNKQAIQNIGAFQTYYRNYVYAAVQLKIVTPENNKVLPSKQLSVKDVLSMLVKITPQ